MLQHLEALTSAGARRSHWIAKGLAGTRIEWDAEILEDRPNARIAWLIFLNQEDTCEKVVLEPQ